MRWSALFKRWGNDYQTPGSRGFKELRRSITHPMQIIESPFLPDKHPLKRQAYAVFDAWDSATNGMEDLDAWSRLAEITDKDIFHPWKLFVWAIRAFYARKDEDAASYLAQIPGDCPLAAPSRHFLRHLAHPQLTLIPGLSFRSRLQGDCLENIESTAYPETEDFYLEALEEALDLFEVSPQPIRQALLCWGARLGAERGMPLEKLIHLARRRLGRSEAQKALAVALYPLSPETALLFWAQGLADQETPYTIEDKATLELLEKQTRLYQTSYGVDPGFDPAWALIAEKVRDLRSNKEVLTSTHVVKSEKPRRVSPHGQLELFTLNSSGGCCGTI